MGETASKSLSSIYLFGVCSGDLFDANRFQMSLRSIAQFSPQ